MEESWYRWPCIEEFQRKTEVLLFTFFKNRIRQKSPEIKLDELKDIVQCLNDKGQLVSDQNGVLKNMKFLFKKILEILKNELLPKYQVLEERQKDRIPSLISRIEVAVSQLHKFDPKSVKLEKIIFRKNQKSEKHQNSKT